MAEKMVTEKMAAESKPAQPETPKPETEQTVTPEDSKPTDTKPDEQKPDTEKVTGNDKPDEGKKDKPDAEKNPAKDDVPPSKKYSKDERMAHAFAREKQKRKEQKEKYEAKIKDLTEKLEKYKGLKLEDFGGNTDDFVNWKLEEQKMQEEVKLAKQRIEDNDAQDLREETERRVNLSFGTAEERQEYEELISNKWPSFKQALDKFDPEHVVINYLSSLEKYPLVLKKLMTDMDALKMVFRDRSPRMIEDNLHTLAKEVLGYAQGSEQKTETKPTENAPKPEEKKPSIPIIGRQVTAGGSPNEPVHDRAYWNDYLRKHPRG